MDVRIATWIVAAAIMLGAGSAGAQDEPAAGGSPPPEGALRQEFCPVLTDEKIDPTIFTEYEGRRVYLCCKKCKVKFEREPEKYPVLLVGQSTEPAQATPADSAGEANGDEGSAPGAPGHDMPKMDHGTGGAAERPEGVARLIAWLGRFHPAATDFPVALLSAALVAEVLFILRKRTLFDDAGRFCIWGAALTGVATAMLGWFFAGFRLGDDDRLLMIHRWMGTGAALFIVLVLVLSERARSVPARARGIYRTVLFGTAMLVLGTAFVGGAMVWGLDHYWAP